MEPTCPIKTFAPWMLHNVELTDETHGWDLKCRIQADGYFHFSRAHGYQPDEVGMPGFFIATTTMGSNGSHHFYFNSEEDAKRFIDYMGKGEYNLLPHDQSPLRNSGIWGNFTLKDMMDIFGDPLPDKIKDILIDLRGRGIHYFNEYCFMHQDWKKHKWWPEAFVYQCPVQDVRSGHDVLCWFHESGISWDDYVNHLRGIEFRHANDAMLFKLAFGEDKIHPIALERLEEKWQEFVDELSPISRGW